MADFDKAIEVVLRHEGGFVDDPVDPGGATKYGVSLRWLKASQIDIDEDGDIDAQDVRQLSRAQARQLYRERFWDYDQVRDQALATKLLDTGVNMGTAAAHRLLQKALNELGNRLDLDGVLGPRTLAAVNLANPAALLCEYRALQAARYAKIILRRPSMVKYVHGWMRRAVS